VFARLPVELPTCDHFYAIFTALWVLDYAGSVNSSPKPKEYRLIITTSQGDFSPRWHRLRYIYTFGSSAFAHGWIFSFAVGRRL
jgi:hypothetical protein